MKNLCLVFSILILTFTCSAQNPWELGGEYMMPIGKGYKSNIAGLRYENFNNKASFSIGITYHFSPRDAYGGFKGYGMYAGFRSSFGNNVNGSNPFIGLRVFGAGRSRSWANEALSRTFARKCIRTVWKRFSSSTFSLGSTTAYRSNM